MSKKIPRFSQGMGQILDLLNLLQGSLITIPTDYRSQVIQVKNLMKNDESGLINSLLDFGISSAADVSFSVESNNEVLDSVFNNWLGDINSSLLGRIPIGIEALAKEYYRERWKGSSFLLLRTIWENVDGLKLPVKMWFVDGEDIDVEDNSKYVILGNEKYSLITDKLNEEYLSLPFNSREKIFVQKPYTAWGTLYPTPFLIQRGLYKNAMFLQTLMSKGEQVVAKALEYLMVVKKGTEALARENRSEFIYGDEDLKAVKKQLGLLAEERGTTNGVPSYITNFDTDIEHIIPEYERILKPSLYSPIEKRILAGMGMLEIVDIGSSRRESVFNPKPYIGELNSAANDFGTLIRDILLAIIIENKNTHPKYFSSKNSIQIRRSPIKAFMSEEYKTLLRSLYDRGTLSKQTFVELVGEINYKEERDRRIKETKLGDTKTFYPPVIQNLEQHPDDVDNNDNIDDEDLPEDKKGLESRNYNNAIKDKELEKAPYNKLSDLPSNVLDVMSKSLANIWMKVFNDAYSEGEDYARKVAWSVIKKIATKNSDGKWIKKKSKGSIEDLVTSAVKDLEYNDTTLDDVYKMKKIEFLDKKQELLSKLFSKENNENSQG